MLDRASAVFGRNSQHPPAQPYLGGPQVSRVTLARAAQVGFYLEKSCETICDRTVVGYKHTWMLRKRYGMNVSYKIFSGWDFTIQDPDSASLKQSCIRNDLKVNLADESQF